MKKIMMVVFSLVILAGVLGIAYSDATGSQDLTANGVVASKDWVGQILNIRCYIDNAVDQVTFYVADGAQVYKRGASWSFSELNVGDSVTVTYHNRPNNWPMITRIDIN